MFQSRFKILSNANSTLKKLPKIFVKFYQRGEISPNLVTLLTTSNRRKKKSKVKNLNKGSKLNCLLFAQSGRSCFQWDIKAPFSAINSAFGDLNESNKSKKCNQHKSKKLHSKTEQNQRN